jgi:ketosteroid isomerase-like protein
MSINVAPLLAIACFAWLGIAPLALASESSDRASIEAAAQAWVKAFNARDAKALLTVATDDLVLIDSSGPPMSGARAREGWKKAMGASQGQLTSVTKEIVIAGDVAWRIAALKQGQALEIWQRVGGEWKIHRQMSANLLTQSNVSQPPSEPVLDRPTN